MSVSPNELLAAVYAPGASGSGCAPDGKMSAIDLQEKSGHLPGMKVSFSILAGMAVFLAAHPASAATSVYTAVLTHEQFTTRLPGGLGRPPGGGASGGQTTINTGSNSVGPGQVQNQPAIVPAGQATLQFDDVALSWSLTGAYSGFQGSILGVELFGAAKMGFDAPESTRYVFPLQNDGGTSGGFSGQGTFSPVQAEDLRNGLLAFIIRTNLGAGETIRGQVTAVPEATAGAFLLFVGMASAFKRTRRTRF